MVAYGKKVRRQRLEQSPSVARVYGYTTTYMHTEVGGKPGLRGTVRYW